jgi:hypothetical protein
MFIDDLTHDWLSPSRYIRGRVELYENLKYKYRYDNNKELKSFTIERLGSENKFFGYGVSQKLTLSLVDNARSIEFDASKHTLRAKLYSAGNDFITTYPLFYISEIKRDENTNELTVTAFDILQEATKHTVSELNLSAPYNIDKFINACIELLGIDFYYFESNTEVKHMQDEYITGANFEGTETIREALDAVADATQTIYFVNYANFLVFKRLDVAGDAVYTIDKANYYTLESKSDRRLTTVISATELGDNVSASLEEEGDTHYVRDNALWELRDDIATLVEDALDAAGGLTLNQFSCSWRGNPCIEIGDKIDIVTKDDNTITSYVINDSINYSGGLSQDTSWSYTEGDETSGNPSTLGEALKKTFAKVDKAKAEISIVAGETAELKLTSDSVQTAVKRIDNNIADVIAEVNTKVSAEDVNITIQSVLDEGVGKVTTATGFTFNEEGLHITKSNSEITTSINEDGMKVYRNNDEVLVADNLGVKAEDLHATTFLIIGKNSRLEDYDSGRTGCFWIGG